MAHQRSPNPRPPDRDIQYQLLERMIRVREFEEAVAHHYAEQEMRCPVHLSIGQEGPPSGICQVLTADDMLFSHHRSHGHYVAKGGHLGRLVAEFYGKAEGCCQGIGGSMHLVDQSVGFMASIPIVGGIVPIGVGAAMSARAQKKDLVSLIFVGDATMEEGAVFESMNFASLKKLPVIFFCENNFYSVYTHLRDRQPERPISDLAKAHAMPTLSVDGNDVLDVYQASVEAYQYAKSGRGPIFIEASTYRWREHCGPNYDNDIGYRTEEEFLQWKAKCPIEKLKATLSVEDPEAQYRVSAIYKKIGAEITDAFEFAKKSPFPEVSQLFKNIYAD